MFVATHNLTHSTSLLELLQRGVDKKNCSEKEELTKLFQDRKLSLLLTSCSTTLCPELISRLVQAHIFWVHFTEQARSILPLTFLKILWIRFSEKWPADLLAAATFLLRRRRRTDIRLRSLHRRVRLSVSFIRLFKRPSTHFENSFVSSFEVSVHQ